MSLRPTWDERCPTLGHAAALLALGLWSALVVFSRCADRVERWVERRRA